jgi:hypothetical protein
VASLFGLLLGATATALGVLVSWWLVPVYLLGMIWLLLPAEHLAAWRQRRATASGGLPGKSPLRNANEPLPEPARVDWVQDAGETIRAGVAGEPAAAVLTRPRRKRAPRKPRGPAVAAEPAVATWVQVGPGRFVRVETAGPAPDPADSAVLNEPTADELEGETAVEDAAPSEAVQDALEMEETPQESHPVEADAMNRFDEEPGSTGDDPPAACWEGSEEPLDDEGADVDPDDWDDPGAGEDREAGDW